MTATVKIFGERNTSTNALKAVIESNSHSRTAPAVALELDPGLRQRLKMANKVRAPHWFKERMIDRVFANRSPLEAWKHTTTEFDDVSALVGCHVVFAVRHPASWVLGLYRRPYQIGGNPAANLEEFLEKRWETVEREGLGRVKTGAMALYNVKMAAFLTLQSRLEQAGGSYSVVRQEDFAVDQAGVFAKLKPHLLRPVAAFQSLDASTKPGGKSRADYEAYYGQQLWLNEIDMGCRARITDEIDWSLVAQLDYSPI
jgi:hypothetical protein